MQALFQKKSFEFPVSTLLGSSCSNLMDIAGARTIDKGFKRKYLFTKFASRMLSAFRFFEEHPYQRAIQRTKIVQAPIFIIGFWRSGTTVLHNLLCRNPEFGFVNTYQAVFPNHVLANQWWLKNIAKLLLPETRPGDDLKFDFAFPQEEEIALGNLQPLSFYNFFYFPRDIANDVRESLLFEGIAEEKKSRWKEAYTRLIKIALVNTGGKQFVSKNPPNTFRIKLLLEMFPDAKFIYLHRNTYDALSSFFPFVHAVHHGLKLQSYDKTAHELQLIRLYKNMKLTFSRTKSLIPDGQLVDMKYEHFERNMKDEMVRVYDSLKLKGLDNAMPLMNQYLDMIEGYSRNKHKPDKKLINLIDTELGELVEL